jgi:hypothetical protein
MTDSGKDPCCSLFQPKSLFESGLSSGEVSLQGLFDGEFQSGAVSRLDIGGLTRILCFGCLAENSAEVSEAAEARRTFLHGLVSRILSAGVRRSRIKLIRCLRTEAEYAGDNLSCAELSVRMAPLPGGDAADAVTVRSYRSYFVSTGVLRKTEAWRPVLSARATVRRSARVVFSDPVVCAALLNLTPDEILWDYRRLWALYGALALRDLALYTGKIGGRLFHYRDSLNLTADAVIVRPDGTFGLIQTEAGGEPYIDEAAVRLKKLEKKLDREKMPAPSFKMVLAGVGDFAYQRRDGVMVVPIGCLKN